MFTKFASYKVLPVMVSTHGSVVPLAMFLIVFCLFVYFWEKMERWIPGGSVEPCVGSCWRRVEMGKLALVVGDI